MTAARTPRLPPAIEIDIAVDTERWREAPRARAIIRRAIGAAHLATRGRKHAAVAVAVLLTGDAHIRRINAQWRRKAKATNVLSFPAAGTTAAARPRHLGDIVIAYETLAREAQRDGKTFAQHLAHLSVHGFLHLVGHDHVVDAEAETMEQLEREILKGLRVPDPYAFPAASQSRRKGRAIKTPKLGKTSKPDA